jgi:hypothetical protein
MFHPYQSEIIFKKTHNLRKHVNCNERLVLPIHTIMGPTYESNNCVSREDQSEITISCGRIFFFFFFFFFFFDNYKLFYFFFIFLPHFGGSNLDVSLGRRQKLPPGHKAWLSCGRIFNNLYTIFF